MTKYFHGAEEFLSGIWGDQCVILREHSSPGVHCYRSVVTPGLAYKSFTISIAVTSQSFSCTYIQWFHNKYTKKTSCIALECKLLLLFVFCPIPTKLSKGDKADGYYEYISTYFLLFVGPSLPGFSFCMHMMRIQYILAQRIRISEILALIRNSYLTHVILACLSRSLYWNLDVK